MKTRRPPRSSPVWVAAGAAFSGAATYLLLVVTARAVGPAAYGEFSLFWAGIVIVSLGLFLPVEQVMARWTARLVPPTAPLDRLSAPHAAGLRAGLALTSPAVIALTAFWLLRPGADTATAVPAITAFTVAVLAFVLQFSARGVLAGRVAMRSYAAVIGVDSGIRAAAALLLWTSGVTSPYAYAAAVAGSALVCGVVGTVLASRAGRRVEIPGPGASSGTTQPAAAGFGSLSTSAGPERLRVDRRELAGVVVAALGMQALLNSGIVVAGIAARGDQAVLAGHLLAVLTLGRIPVFVFQSAQATYVGRVAGRVHRHDAAGLRRILVRLAGAVAVTCVVTVMGAASVGPAAVRLVFGTGYDITRGGAIVVALGIAAYLVASVTNDVAVALGVHQRIGPSWIAGVGAAALVAVLVPDLLLRSTLPLIVGSVVAAALLGPAVRARLQAGLALPGGPR